MGGEAFYNYNPVKEEIDSATEKETKNGKWESREDKFTLFLKFRPLKICVHIPDDIPDILQSS